MKARIPIRAYTPYLELLKFLYAKILNHRKYRKKSKILFQIFKYNFFDTHNAIFCYIRILFKYNKHNF